MGDCTFGALGPCIGASAFGTPGPCVGTAAAPLVDGLGYSFFATPGPYCEWTTSDWVLLSFCVGEVREEAKLRLCLKVPSRGCGCCGGRGFCGVANGLVPFLLLGGVPIGARMPRVLPALPLGTFFACAPVLRDGCGAFGLSSSCSSCETSSKASCTVLKRSSSKSCTNSSTNVKFLALSIARVFLSWSSTSCSRKMLRRSGAELCSQSK
mmetsp:Transcript_35132/g.80438  ORF Transcript_35132/g.80438 Transcript_35132/m.80438 type:complete len:210 (-) Transcript_35132:227-856(-)